MENFSSLVANVPVSVLPDPPGVWDKVKYVFWRGITPYFLFLRDGLVRYHLIHHAGRQHFLLGKFPIDKFEEFLKYLQAQGFGNHFIAWKDQDQLVSLRLFDGFERQYHLRIFNDGEVRGHYEFTPESHPLLHFFESGIEERRADFLRFLGDWVVRDAK